MTLVIATNLVLSILVFVAIGSLVARAIVTPGRRRTARARVTPHWSRDRRRLGQTRRGEWAS
jgi:hypothetical protein